ncbi:MAG: methionyl-tRNA formyltransferase [Acidobacteria bacterium]|nr:MAG: methionyl-tRNA formyltransferase [Acidobacteriota bacterium]
MKIAFFGTPAFAVPSLEQLVAAGDQIVVAITQPDRPRGRGHHVQPSPLKTAALAHGIPVLQPERVGDPAFAAALASCGADLGVVAAYGKILPDAILHTPRHGTINVHASLLPRFRGAAPVHRAIIAGERETGVTMIRLVREMDAGPMLARAVRPIADDETSDVVDRALAEIGASLLVSTVREIAAGRVTEQPQDHALATLAPRLTSEDGRLDWTRPARAIHNLVRGLHPWPHAFSFLDTSRYLILRTEVEPASVQVPAQAPGHIVEAGADRLRVACGEGTVLAILALQPEGRRRLPTRAFLAGHPIDLPAIFRPFPPTG